MHLMIFVTNDGETVGTAPTLFVPESDKPTLPGHPRSQQWHYVATISADDNLALSEPGLLDAIELVGFFVTNRLVMGAVESRPKKRASNPEIVERRKAAAAVAGLSREIGNWNQRAAFLGGMMTASKSSGVERREVLAKTAALRKEVEMRRAAFRRSTDGNFSSPIQNVGAAIDALLQRLSLEA
jgi:hypothetical protein